MLDNKKNNNKISVAIIGGGAAAIVFLKSFTQELIRNQISSIEICIFESASQIGVGNAYQQDLSNLLINRPLQTMSANAVALDEFQIGWRLTTVFCLEVCIFFIIRAGFHTFHHWRKPSTRSQSENEAFLDKDSDEKL